MDGNSIFLAVTLVPINIPNIMEVTTAIKYGGTRLNTVSTIILHTVPSFNNSPNVKTTLRGDGKNQLGIQLK